MMEVTTTVKGAAAVVVAIATTGGGALKLNDMHAPREDFNQHVSSDRVRTILDYVDRAKRERSDWICRAIESEFIALCTELPDHYLCTDPSARKDLKKKAGCA